MPTARPRHTITETDAIAAAIDEAASEWPEDRRARARLLTRLIEAGHEAISDERAARAARRREAVRETRGALADAYPPGYLEELRKDWPD